jgi:hypothetical protein
LYRCTSELAAVVDKAKHNQGNTITVFGHAVGLCTLNQVDP